MKISFFTSFSTSITYMFFDNDPNLFINEIGTIGPTPAEISYTVYTVTSVNFTNKIINVSGE